MRLQQYINNKLNEELVIDDWNEMKTIIKKDCSKFLKEFGSTPIYRGTNDVKKDNTLIRMKSRTNRKPTDTPRHLHDLMDDLFEKHHGWRARSEGVFVTKDLSTARNYGKPALFFPKGYYKYLWSEDIEDLYVDIRKKIIKKVYDIFILTKDLKPEHITPEFKTILEDMIKIYTRKDFKYSDDKECMFKVRNYYLIRFDTPSERLSFMDEVSS